MNSVSARLLCFLSKGPLKQDFMDIYLTTFFRVRKFKNASVMRAIFYLKILKIEPKFGKIKKKFKKKIFFKVIAAKDVAINCLY